MSKIFYDHLVVFEELEFEVDKMTKTPEEREELWKIIDEILHLRILASILDSLPNEHHREFLEKFHASPYDDSLMSFLNERIETDIEIFLKEEIKKLEKEIVKNIKGGKV